MSKCLSRAEVDRERQRQQNYETRFRKPIRLDGTAAPIIIEDDYDDDDDQVSRRPYHRSAAINTQQWTGTNKLGAFPDVDASSLPLSQATALFSVSLPLQMALHLSLHSALVINICLTLNVIASFSIPSYFLSVSKGGDGGGEGKTLPLASKN